MVPDHPLRYKVCAFKSAEQLLTSWATHEGQKSHFCVSTAIITQLTERLAVYVHDHLESKLVPYLVNHGISTWGVFYVKKSPRISLGICRYYEHLIVVRWSLGQKTKRTTDWAGRERSETEEDKKELVVQINIADPDIINKAMVECIPVFAGMRTEKYFVLPGFPWLP